MKNYVKGGISFAVVGVLVSLTPLGSAVNLPVDFQSFEVDREGWDDYFESTVTREMSGTGSGAYAAGVASATGLHHARMDLGECESRCIGPFTRWGAYGDSFPAFGYATEIKVYLDMDYAAANPDERFDWSSAINRSTGGHLRDFIFNVGTSPVGNAEWVVSASHNSYGWPSNPARSPVTVDESGWYTFRQTFADVGGFLSVTATLVAPDGSEAGSWALGGTDPMSEVGGNRYGWFAVVDTDGLVFDDATRIVCTPVGPVGAVGCWSIDRRGAGPAGRRRAPRPPVPMPFLCHGRHPSPSWRGRSPS